MHEFVEYFILPRHWATDILEAHVSKIQSEMFLWVRFCLTSVLEGMICPPIFLSVSHDTRSNRCR